jgi:predicted DsbA family dithiol-disulfide isomerase
MLRRLANKTVCPMTKALKIDFVSDVACPWCIIGLKGLDQALERTKGEIEADITFHPFELNPTMPAGGQNMIEHVGQKYGSTPDQARVNRERIRTRAAELGFDMGTSDASRIYNTFDAHRLLAWAKEQGQQIELKRSLFTANFTEQQDPGNHDVLVAAAERAGLDAQAAREVLTSGRYADEVREEQRLWQSRGISSVPSLIINDKFLISGGQPPEVFEKALREIAGIA